MKVTFKFLFAASLLSLSMILAACSSLPAGTTTTGGSTFTISGNITNLVGSGMVIADNGTDMLTITGTGTVPFTFKKSVSSYSVTVLTPPSNPAQTCTVTGGTGTATAAVTTVSIACTTNPVTATIGGMVSGLVNGSSVILQNNGGDSLTIVGTTAASISFTFSAPVTGPTDAYAVTVNTQPTGPNQICTVAKGSGTATANVTDVAVTCVLSYTIGGTVSGLVGTGLILEDSTTMEQLPISPANGNQAFTFKQLVPTGTMYTVTVFAEPTGPGQTCTVATGTGSGTATSNVTSVQINCPAVTYSIGGVVVGLQGKTPTPPNSIDLPLTDGSFQIQNNLGNTLVVTQNGPFTFATPEALDDQYEISVFHGASTQTQGCTLWNYKGVVTANVTSIVVDCAHNDWTWTDGTNIAGTISQPQYGNFPSSAPTSTPDPLTNTPGARYSGATWTDKYGNLFLFGGDGWELSGNPQPANINGPMSDMWVCAKIGDYCQWQLIGGYDTTAATPPPGATFTTVGGGIYYYAQFGLGYPTPVPGARLGAATWTDASGNFWIFGGSDTHDFANDLWEYNTASLNPSNYTTTEGTWVEKVAGGANQGGTYSGGTLIPGARTNAVTWTDASGNFWLFGGYGYDSQSTLGYLNDLWEYTGGAWVFVSGGTTNLANQNGNYGSQNTAATTNMPGGRQEAVGWADASGNLWLFGGEGLDSVGTSNGILNDLWVYNISGKEWTFVAGSSTANKTGVYPSQTVTGPANTTYAAGTCGLSVGDAPLSCGPVSLTGALPGSRWGASAWVDAAGNFWLLGGWGLDSTGTNGNGALNDLWVYTPNSTATATGTWAWIKGSNTGSQNGIYGNEIIPFETYELWTPGGRSNAMHWTDSKGQFWLFGGAGYDSTNTTGNGYLNDMWRYLPYP